MLVFVRISTFCSDPQYRRSIVVPLVRQSLIVESAVGGLRCNYKLGFQYAKAGVMLELQPGSMQQGELDLESEGGSREIGNARLMTGLDGLIRRYAHGTVLMATAGLYGDRRTWAMKQKRRTPQHTTLWEDIR